MCSADKVSDMDTVYRADLGTRTATGAKLVIYNCEVVLYGNSAVWTGLLALHTADTAVRTGRSGLCAFIMARAFYNNSCSVVDKVDK